MARHLPGLIRLSSKDEASATLNGAHYLGALEYQPRFVLTTEARDAFAVFSPPVASHFKQLPGFNPIELARLWQDNACTRPLSKFLGACLRALPVLDESIDCV